MHRIDSATAEADTHGVGKDGFTEGGGGTPPTQLTGDWFNAVQEEICNLLEDNGVALNKADNTQLLDTFRAPTGSGSSAAIHGTGGSSNGPGLEGTGGATNGVGLKGNGTGTGAGVSGTGGSSNGHGVSGTGGATNGVGVNGQGTGTGSGVKGTGGATSGIGVEGVGGSTNGIGVKGTGVGTGAGVYAIGGPSGGWGAQVEGGAGATGLVVTAGSGNADGAEITGEGTGSGVIGTGGGSSGIGVRGVGGSTNGIGVRGEGTGTGYGVYGLGTNGYGVVAESDTSSPLRAALFITPQDTDPSVTTAGQVYIHSTSHMMNVRGTNGWSRLIGRCYGFAGSENTAATTSPTNFTNKFSIAANTLRVGQTIRIRASGVDSSSTGNAALSLYFAGQAIGSISNRAIDASSPRIWELEATLTITAVGASGSFRAVSLTKDQINGGSPVMRFERTFPGAVNFTTAQEVAVQYTLSSSSGQLQLERLVVDISD